MQIFFSDMKVGYLPPGRLQLILTPYTVSMNQLTKSDFGKDSSILDAIAGKTDGLVFGRERQSAYPCYVLPR